MLHNSLDGDSFDKSLAFTRRGYVVNKLRRYNCTDRQLKFLSKFPITFVMGWYGHNGSGAIAAKHVVGYPDGNLLAGRRVNRVSAGEDAGLFPIGFLSFNITFGLDGLEVCPDMAALFGGRNFM